MACRTATRAFVVVALGAALAACTAPPASTDAVFTEWAEGVHVHRGAVEDWGPGNLGDVANTGLVIGSRCAAVIDTGGTRATGRKLAAAVRGLTDKPVCWVIATHAHPDHVLGSQGFIDAANAAGHAAPVFVGHARLPVALAVRGPYYLNALKRDFGPAQAEGTALVAPTLRVDDVLELDLGGRVLELKAWPTAHTDADLSVFDRESRTLFLGDLLFVEHAPVLDGRLKGWLAAMKQWGSWPVAVVVPGHGAPSREWLQAVRPQQRYLETLEADVRRAIKDGLTLRQAVERIAPDRADWRLLDVFHARNVTAAYAELEWDE